MITLYHAPRSRSSRIIWLLEELGADYELKTVTIRRTDGSDGPDPANPHPHKQVPALEHDGRLITESGAVLLYLADLFPDAGLAPAPGDPQRGDYLTWLFYYSGVVEPLLQMHWSKFTETDPNLKAQFDAMTARFIGGVTDRPWLLGDRFSAADIPYVSLLQFARPLLPESAALDAYAERVAGRPALQRAMQKDG